MESSTMTQNKFEVHFVLIPLMAQGHLLPMVDVGRLLVRRNNVKVTILTTPLNAFEFEQVLIERYSVALHHQSTFNIFDSQMLRLVYLRGVRP
ncbi:hypothetical protein QN277_020015 [Acacia crassicarpa]|uniref:Uncharacterized protein n=1 Tax=Acacia crassicarpa TaxID=499986 RepID=A0AAE1JNM4_9FABA|nr:hypothetical protein QN277_020015 [Acacia crassicarpa]